jgi:ATP-dependent Clp protease ATP-binding subunit ClpX
MDEVEFINDEALDFIVDKALEYKLARGLRSLCVAVLTDAMYDYQVLMTRHWKLTKYAKKPR